MNDYYLKTNSEHDLYQALLNADLVEYNNEQLRYIPKGISLDVIGLIYKPTGNMITTTEMTYPEMAPIQGYHANIRGSLTEEQQANLPLVSAPATPYRVWA